AGRPLPPLPGDDGPAVAGPAASARLGRQPAGGDRGDHRLRTGAGRRRRVGLTSGRVARARRRTWSARAGPDDLVRAAVSGQHVEAAVGALLRGPQPPERLVELRRDLLTGE